MSYCSPCVVELRLSSIAPASTVQEQEEANILLLQTQMRHRRSGPCEHLSSSSLQNPQLSKKCDVHS